RQADGVRQLPGEGQPLLHVLPGLLWIAEPPEGYCQEAVRTDPTVLAITEGMSAMGWRRVERDALLEMHAGGGQVSEAKEGLPQPSVRCHTLGGGVETLGEAEELLSQRACGLELCSHGIKVPQLPEHEEELWRVPSMLTQLPGATVDFGHLRGG